MLKRFGQALLEEGKWMLNFCFKFTNLINFKKDKLFSSPKLKFKLNIYILSIIKFSQPKIQI